MSNDRAKVRKAAGFYLTRTGRIVLVCILVAVAIWPVGIQPQATQAAPPPTPIATPTPQPTEPGLSAQGTTPPSPDNLPPGVEQARARQAMEAALAKYLRYWGPCYQVAPVEVAVEDEWAHGVAQWQSQTRALSGWFSSSGSDATSHYYYVRLYPAGPLVSAILDQHGIEDVIRPEDSVIARLTLDQMTNVYNDIILLQEGKGLLVSFESVPWQTYEMRLQPWEVGQPAEVEGRTGAEIRAPRVVAIVVDQSIYNNIQSALSTYISDVTSRWPNLTLLVYESSAATSESLRGFLQNIHQNQSIQGAILVGSLPYAEWELPWGEECSLPLFYEDLDGVFLDQDSDGLYDYRDWGSNEGVEIWVSWIRPPSQDAVSALQAYFQKTHNYYSGAYPMPERGLLAITHDWWACGDAMRAAFEDLYGQDVDQLGGCEDCYAQLEPYLQLYTNNGYGAQNLWVHSSNTGHQFDSDPGKPNWLSATDLATLTNGPQFSVIWGCHAMDLMGDPDTIFATRYIMGTHNGLAALGVTRSIGTPEQEWLLHLLSQTANLGNAVFQYLNLVTDRDYIYEQYPDELHTFVWDIALIGDPFMFFDTASPTGQITSPSDGAVIGDCPLTIQAEASDGGSGVDVVEFHAYYDGSWHHLGDDSTRPYSWDWDCSSVSDQGVWLSVHVWDNAGNEVMDPGGYVYITLDRFDFQVFLPCVLKDYDPSMPTPTPTLTVETLNFKVSFQGRDSAADKPQNVPIEVTVKNLSLDQVFFESGWVPVTPVGGSNNWGIASVDVSSAGLVSGQSYQVFVKGAMHLAKRITTSLADGQTVDYTDPDLNPDGFLRAGDIDQDNRVGVADLTILLSNFGGTPPANPDPSSEIYRSDFNGDGTINVSDQVILLESWGTGDPY